MLAAFTSCETGTCLLLLMHPPVPLLCNLIPPPACTCSVPRVLRVIHMAVARVEAGSPDLRLDLTLAQAGHVQVKSGVGCLVLRTPLSYPLSCSNTPLLLSQMA